MDKWPTHLLTKTVIYLMAEFHMRIVTINRTTRSHSPEDNSLHCYRSEDLKYKNFRMMNAAQLMNQV
jgi:hypothetical protein